MWHVGLTGLDDNLNRIRATRTSRISDDLLALQNLVCQEIILLFEICSNARQVVSCAALFQPIRSSQKKNAFN